MNLIIFGQMGSGKDTLALLLTYTTNSEILKLGQKIRNEVYSISEYHKSDKDMRTLFQEYGQGMRKIFGDDIWCNYVKQQMESSKLKSFIIADGRQQNELEYFTKLGFIPIAIKCDKEIRKKRLIERDKYTQEGFEHETELSVANIINQIELSGGYVLDNSKGIKELEEQVELLVKNIKK